jgi:hypothetical protein
MGTRLRALTLLFQSNKASLINETVSKGDEALMRDMEKRVQLYSPSITCPRVQEVVQSVVRHCN